MNKEKIIGDILTATQFKKLGDDIKKNKDGMVLSIKRTIPDILENINRIIGILEDEIIEYQQRKYEMEEHKNLIESKIGDKK